MWLDDMSLVIIILPANAVFKSYSKTYEVVDQRNVDNTKQITTNKTVVDHRRYGD